MAKNTWILLILAIVCLQAYGIYEHEVGRNEWFIQTLGGEIYDSHSPKDYPHLLLTISKKILTGVNQETGKIIWRKELVDTGCHSMKVFDDYVLIKGKNSIQVFTIGRGELVTSLNSQNAISDAALVVKDDGKKVPIIVFSEKEGETLAYINAKKHASQETSYLGLNVDHSGALIGISHNGKSHELYKIDPETLKATVINKNIKIADKLGPRVWYKSTRKFFAITDFEGKSIVSLNKVYFTGSVEKVEDVEGLTFRDLAHTSKNIFAPFAKSNNLGSPFLLKVSDATLNIFKKGELVATLNEVNYQKSGDILRVFLHDKAFLVQMKDLSLHYISKEGFNRKWKREESLANIDKFKFLDITESFTHHDDVADFMKKMDEMGDSIAKVPVKILSRYTFHIQRLFSFVTKLGDLVFNENLFSKKDDVHTRDTFGFKKLIIGLSKNHDTLVCLQSNNGQLLWTLHFTKFLRDAGSLRNEKDELTFSDFHLIEKEGDDNEAVVLISTKQGNTLLITVDPYAGTIKDTRLYSGHQTTHSFKLHLASLHEVILLIDEKQMKTQFYPKIENPKINSDPTNLDFFNGMASMTHSFVHKVDINVDSEIGNSGFELLGELFDFDSCSTKDESCLSLSWKIPMENQELIAYSTKYIPERTHFHSQRASNLNGGILFKYLEPSLFAIATKSTYASEKSNGLFIYIIEGTTGRIVHQFYEINVNHEVPINLLFDENALILTYERIGKFGEGVQQIQTVNLFEQNIRHNVRDVIVDYVKGVNSTDMYGEMPIILQQAFIFPETIKGLGISRTLQGITGKDILLILENDQIYALKGLSISPRRPLEESMKENLNVDVDKSLDDNLLPTYDAYLDFNPSSMISHKYNLKGMEKVETSPSQIESTCLSITYGSDLFYTTLAPEKQFDVLSEDFNKGALILTCLGLMIATKLAGWYFEKRRLTSKAMKE
ncbi:unnamed protein product [Moneuplotes crassus]|uniref:ER membrane protein complex subunit 1 n=1 Tax=Euplotes crassus TaxID=5936 RepID=A0AAD1Y239_EUPCR|nr:unnamed protein product [Moneuplotes crassus]